MRSTRVPALLLGCALLAPLSTQAAPAAAAPFQLTDLRRIVSLGEPQIAPDGRRIAVIVATPDWKTDKSVQQLDLVALILNFMSGTTLKS